VVLKEMVMRWEIVVVRVITGMALIALPSATTGGQRSASPKIIRIVAERFVFTPAEISVEEGSTVEFRVSSDDTSHGFRLTGPGDAGNAAAIDLEIPKRGRGEARATFQATMVGRYTFECTRVCGAGHDFMRGTLRVTPRAARAASSGPRPIDAAAPGRQS
jgi:cytochrome c oxidase subunit 2